MDGIFHVPYMAKGEYVFLSLFHKSPVMVTLGRLLTGSGGRDKPLGNPVWDFLDQVV